MQQFNLWLSQNRGMATTLAKALDIHRANITNVKTGRNLMPNGWMPVVVALSKQKLSFATLVTEREEQRKAKASERNAMKVSVKST